MPDYDRSFYRSDGKIYKVISANDFETIQMNTPPGALYVDEFCDDLTSYVDAGQVLRMPDPPGDWAIFDYAEKRWIDPRDPAEELALRRASASMTRSDFLLAAISAGIIQPSDAGPAARGEIPPSLSPVFDALLPEVQVEAVVRWGAATMIDRTNPVLAVLAEAMSLTDAQLDALFGL